MIFLLSDDDKGSFLEFLISATMNDESAKLILIGNSDNLFFDSISTQYSHSTWFKVNKRWPSFEQFLCLLSLVKNSQSQTIFASGYTAHVMGMIAGFFAKKNRRIFVRHFSDIHYSLRNFHWFLVDVITNILATQIIVVSELVKSLMERKECVAPSKITVIDNSIALDDLFKVRWQRRFSPSSVNIGAVGRQTSSKDFISSISAFRNLLKLNVDVHLHIFGDKGDSTPEIMRELQMIPSDRYTLHGKVHDRGYIYSTLDILIHVPNSETSEAFGQVYIEGLASGAQCIFSRSGVLSSHGPHFLDEFIWYVDYKNPRDILSCLEKIVLDGSRKSMMPLKLFDRYRVESVINLYLIALKEV